MDVHRHKVVEEEAFTDACIDDRPKLNQSITVFGDSGCGGGSSFEVSGS